MVQQEKTGRVILRDAIPGMSLFSYNLATGECRLSDTKEYTPEEIRDGVRKHYGFQTGQGLIFMQAPGLKKAEKEFRRFLKRRKQKLGLK